MNAWHQCVILFELCFDRARHAGHNLDAKGVQQGPCGASKPEVDTFIMRF